MRPKRYRCTRAAVLEYLHITEQELVEYIELGILVPEAMWEEGNYNKYRIDNFIDCSWLDAEIERFQSIATKVKDQSLYFYSQAMVRITEMESSLLKSVGHLETRMKRIEQYQLRAMEQIDKQDILIDFKYFCDSTGYSHQTFLNNVVLMDENKTAMRLAIVFYKDLIWHKIKGKWQTPLAQFMELRSGFNYQIYLDERKRRGEFIPRAGTRRP